jgi:hypothetical protein
MHEKSVLKALLTGLYLPEIAQVIEMDNEAEQAQERNITELAPSKGTSAEDLATELTAQPASAEPEPQQTIGEKPKTGELDIF